MNCRHCNAILNRTFIDLGISPPSNSYLNIDTSRSDKSERCYPLKVLVCDNCWLVQTEDFVCAEEMFSEDYAYFSSFSKSWLNHSKKYVEMMVKRFSLGANSNVVEIAANDGYLLQYIKEKGIACYGVEPTKSTAAAAREKGIEIIEGFFGEETAGSLAAKGRQADLMIANNVLAHVPNINDFVKGFSVLLKSNGVATFEFPHLLNLIKNNQFDTIYHEHYSYLSLISVEKIFEKNGLSIFDVEKIDTHGGSLRVYAQLGAEGKRVKSINVDVILDEEINSGLRQIDFYTGFQNKAEAIKNDLLQFLGESKKNKLAVAAYGAAAKGNTLLNFAGVNSSNIDYVVDLNPAKQNKLMPGSHIPIVSEEHLKSHRPDRILILPWNLKDEIIEQLSYVRDWNAKFVVAIPGLKII